MILIASNCAGLFATGRTGVFTRDRARIRTTPPITATDATIVSDISGQQPIQVHDGSPAAEVVRDLLLHDPVPGGTEHPRDDGEVTDRDQHRPLDDLREPRSAWRGSVPCVECLRAPCEWLSGKSRRDDII